MEMELKIEQYLTPEQLAIYKDLCNALCVESIEALGEKLLQNSTINITNPSFEDLINLTDTEKFYRLIKDKELSLKHQIDIKSTNEVLLKMWRIYYMKYLYENFGLTRVIEFSDLDKKFVIQTSGIEGIDSSDELMNIDLIIEEIKKYDKLNRYAYWNYSRQKLLMFYEMLIDDKFIVENPHFEYCFKHQQPELTKRTKWNKSRADLVFLGYQLWHKRFPKDFHKIICDVFSMDKVKFDPDKILKTYHNRKIKQECKSRLNLSHRRGLLNETLKQVMDPSFLITTK